MCRFERYRGRDHGGVMILTEKTQMTNTTKDARSIEPDAILRYGKMRIPLMAEDLSDLLANEFHGDQDDDWIAQQISLCATTPIHALRQRRLSLNT